MTMTENDTAREKLTELVKPGDTIYTVLRHVARSGMSRSISLMIARDGEIVSLDYWASRLMGDKIDRDNGGIKISGAGMDMGFALVYNLGETLFRDGFECTGDSGYLARCPSNDHSNGDRDYSPHHHKSGGYALRHAWL